MTQKILVTGSREFDNTEMVNSALAEAFGHALQSADFDGFIIVITGSAPGADSIAERLATENPVATSVRVPADWTNNGKAAGPIRNRHMLDLNPDVVLAFYKNGAGNRGTQNCVNQAEARGITVRKYASD